MDPVILLAFANDRSGESYLNELADEQVALSDLLNDRFNVQQRPQATLARISQSFNRYGEDIRIFHFAGHANAQRIILDHQKDGNKEGGYVKGVASYIGRQKGVKLVFLNGCSTSAQVHYFRKAGIPAVIATTAPVNDRLAKEFAILFYTNFIESKQAKSLKIAFEEAKDQLISRDEDYSNFYSRGLKPEEEYFLETFPYEIHYQDSHASGMVYADLCIEEDGRRTDKVPMQHAELMCNRDKVVEAFADAMHNYLVPPAEKITTSKIAVKGLIHGERNELPQDVSKRFEKVELYDGYDRADLLLEKSRLLAVQVEMPDAGTLRTSGKAMLKLREGLKKALDMDFPARQINQMNALNVLDQIDDHIDVVYFEHWILGDDWDANKQLEFWQAYLNKFWNINFPVDAPDVYLVFVLGYPNAKKGFFGTRKNHDTSISTALKDKGVSVYPKLKEVEKKDVQKWNNDYARSAPRLTQQICGKLNQLSMIQVKTALKVYCDGKRMGVKERIRTPSA